MNFEIKKHFWTFSKFVLKDKKPENYFQENFSAMAMIRRMGFRGLFKSTAIKNHALARLKKSIDDVQTHILENEKDRNKTVVDFIFN